MRQSWVGDLKEFEIPFAQMVIIFISKFKGIIFQSSLLQSTAHSACASNWWCVNCMTVLGWFFMNCADTLLMYLLNHRAIYICRRFWEGKQQILLMNETKLKFYCKILQNMEYYNSNSKIKGVWDNFPFGTFDMTVCRQLQQQLSFLWTWTISMVGTSLPMHCPWPCMFLLRFRIWILIMIIIRNSSFQSSMYAHT